MKKSLIYTAIVLMITASLSAEANFGWNQEATGPGPKEKYEFSINDKDIIEAFTKKDQDIINIDNITTPAKIVEKDEKPDVDTIRSFAENGNPSFQFQLGKLYARGEWVEQDWSEAFKWYSLAADKGNDMAQNNLGVMYCYNDKGLTQDFSKAFSLFEKSAAKNNRLAFLNLGEMYKNGEGVEIDYKKAMEYYKKADEALKALEAGFILRVVEQESTF